LITSCRFLLVTEILQIHLARLQIKGVPCNCFLPIIVFLIYNFILLTFLNKFVRGWWTPLLLTAGLSSARYFYRHILRQNSLTQARRNISRHYDLVGCSKLWEWNCFKFPFFAWSLIIDMLFLFKLQFDISLFSFLFVEQWFLFAILRWDDDIFMCNLQGWNLLLKLTLQYFLWFQSFSSSEVHL